MFENVPDPRHINARHDLREMLFIALMEMLCGINNCSDMVLFATQKEQMLRKVLTLAHGIPSHDTFSRLFQRLDPAPLEEAFEKFMRAFAGELAPGGQPLLSIAGKSIKRAYEKGKPHMPPMRVSVWGAALRMTMAQTQAGTGGKAAAALDLIRRVSLKGSIVTADVLHCSKKTAAAILAGGGHYILVLKANQTLLHRGALALLGKKAAAAPSAKSEKKAHGRLETRIAIVVDAKALGWNVIFPA